MKNPWDWKPDEGEPVTEGRATCFACRGKGVVLVGGRQVRPCVNCYAKGYLPSLIEAVEQEQGPVIHCPECGQFKKKSPNGERCIHCEANLERMILL